MKTLTTNNPAHINGGGGEIIFIPSVYPCAWLCGDCAYGG